MGTRVKLTMQKGAAKALRLALCVLMAFAMSACWALAKPERAEAYDGGLDIYVGYSGGPYYLKTHIDHQRLYQLADVYTSGENAGRLTPYQYVYHTSHDGGFTLRKFKGYGVRLSTIFDFAQIKPQDIFRFQIGTGDNYIPDDGAAGYQQWTYNQLVGGTRWYYDGYGDISKFSYDTGTVLDEGALNATRSQVPSILALEWGSKQYEGGTTQEELNATWDNISTNQSDYRLFYGQTGATDGNPRGSAQNVRAITIVLGGNEGNEKAEITYEPPKDANGNTVSEFEVGDDFALNVSMWAHDWFVAQEAIRNGDIQFEVTGDPGVLDVYFDAATGTYRVRVIGEGNASIRAKFGNGQEDYVAYGASMGITGHGSGDGNGDGTDIGGGNGGTDGTDRDGSADGNGVVLGAGTTLTPITMTPKLQVSEGMGENVAEMGIEGGAASDEVVEEQLPEEEEVPLTAHQNYRLDMDEPEVTEPEFDLQDLVPPDAGWAAGGMALLGLGGMAQAVQFRRAKDPADLKREREARS